MGFITRDRLGLSWLRFIGAKDAAVPRSSDELVPVAIVEDLTRGPYPVARRWHGAVLRQPGLAANYTWVGVGLGPESAVGPRARLIIDRIMFASGAAGGYVVGDLDNSLGVTLAQKAAEVSGGDNRQTPPTFTRRDMANVFVESFYNGGGGASIHGWPSSMTAGEPSRIIELGWELGPGMVASFRPSVLNTEFSLWATGRYYEST